MKQRTHHMIVASALTVLAVTFIVGAFTGLGQGAPPLPPEPVPVNVVNPPAEPVPVISLSTAPSEPIYAIGGGTFGEGGFTGFAGVFTVPANKRLVIEHVSAFVQLPVDQSPFGAQLQVLGPSGEFKTHFLVISPQGTTANPLFHTFALGMPIRFYAEPSSSIQFQVQRTAATTGTTTINAAISGHLVSL